MSTQNRGLLDKTWNAVTESQLWRSIFRHGYPDTPLNQSLVMMGNVFLHLHPVKVSRKAMKITYTWCLGGLSFFLFLVLTITGIFLMFYFVPEQRVAYASIQQIKGAVAFGNLVRNMHRWSAHLMVVTVTLHMIRVFYHGAYKPPREFNWVIGVTLFLLTLLLSFTGYLLPWDQIGFWAITVGSNMASYAPLLGRTGTQRPDRAAGGCGWPDAHSFLHPACDRSAARRGGADGGAFLAHPQGWWRGWAAATIAPRA